MFTSLNSSISKQISSMVIACSRRNCSTQTAPKISELAKDTLKNNEYWFGKDFSENLRTSNALMSMVIAGGAMIGSVYIVYSLHERHNELRQDVHELRNELRQDVKDLTGKIENLSNKVDNEMKELRKENRQEMKHLNSRLDTLTIENRQEMKHFNSRLDTLTIENRQEMKHLNSRLDTIMTVLIKNTVSKAAEEQERI